MKAPASRGEEACAAASIRCLHLEIWSNLPPLPGRGSETMSGFISLQSKASLGPASEQNFKNPAVAQRGPLGALARVSVQF